MGDLRNLLHDLDRSREDVTRLHEKLDRQWTTCQLSAASLGSVKPEIMLFSASMHSIPPFV